MSKYKVIDTNVAVVANEGSEPSDLKCQLECVGLLKEARSRGVVLLDTAGEILSEYRKHLSPTGEPRIGDIFYKHLMDHQYDDDKCILVDLAIDDTNGEYCAFPQDPRLEKFDNDDRKFVAVALASGLDCEIFNAVDSDWRDFSAALVAIGVRVNELCPDCLKQ